jgi:beta-glucosidase
VESDWLFGTHADAESVRAGLDIEMPIAMHFSGLPGALERGEIGEQEISASVRRILRAQLCFGLDERSASACRTPRSLIRSWPSTAIGSSRTGR